MLFSDDGFSYSAENEENSNDGSSEWFEINLSTKCGIHPYMFRLEHEKQDSLVSYILIRKTKQVQKQCSGCVLQKAAPKNFKKFTGKHTCQSLFFNKVAGCNIFDVSFPVNSLFLFLYNNCVYITAIGGSFCKWRRISNCR